MRKQLLLVLSLLLSAGAVDSSAQSFLKKLEKSVKKELKKEVDKLVGDDTEQQSQSSKKRSSSQQSKNKSSNSSIPPGAIAPTVVEATPIYTVTGTVAGRQWIDLGLPSGTRWAICNIGATRAEQPGQLFAWGEIATKTSYTQENSKTTKKTMTDISGNKSYDAATVKWGKGWRMPTKAEFEELLHYCGWKYEQRSGRWGAEFTSDSNNKTLFLPVTGYKDGAKHLDANGNGMYWTSTPYTDNYNNGAHEYHFGGALGEMGTGERSSGFAIRAVIDNTDMITTPSQGETNGHKWVDLGLPSGTKWATCNLGAESSEYYGEFYAWAEITPILDKNSPKNNSSDKWMSGIGGSSKYDAATATWGEGWKIPTKKDFEELMENCTWEWTTLGRTKGCKVISKINGNYIFLPATGKMPKNYSYSFPSELGRSAIYWASTPSKDKSYITADGLYMSQSWIGSTTTERKNGHPIRPVTK